MPEDAGKKRFIKDFLQQVKAGEGFIEDIRIERVVRPPGSGGEGSTARSLSGRPISDITQLLKDDLRHCVTDGFFTFRFVAALVGSGKTSLLTYLHELTKIQSTYKNLSIVVRFQLSDLLTMGGSHSFSIKLYCHVLAYTFWELLHNEDLSDAVKNIAEQILNELLDSSEVSQLTSARNFKIQFYPKFNKYLSDSGVGFEDFFFYVLAEVSKVEPLFTFVYLTDELDSLQNFPDYIQDTRSLFKALVKRACQQFRSNIRLLIYLVGTSANVGSFIAGDSVIESLVGDSVINLDKGNSNEFEMIRKEIEGRIQGAYKGYKSFDKAWQEIQNIPLNPANNLRTFCQNYAGEVLQIHEKYFKEEPEKVFEGDARKLIEARCNQNWKNYLNKTAYSLSAVSTTTVLAGHAFDGYVELLHNDNCVARAFGEAKNYELLSGHLETFNQWLEDVNFKPSPAAGTPPDLAFMIAPSCPSLLQQKIELKNIQFIKSDKIIDSLPVETNEATDKTGNNQTNTGTEDSTVSGQTSSSTSPPNWIFSRDTTNAVDINTANKPSLIKTFKGTRVKDATIDRLITRRPYFNLNVMVSDLKFTEAVRQKLEAKLDSGEICFK